MKKGSALKYFVRLQIILIASIFLFGNARGQSIPPRTQLQPINAIGYEWLTGSFKRGVYISGDTLSSADSGAAIIKNGALYIKGATKWNNYGKGKKVNDTTLIIGSDTIIMKGGGGGGGGISSLNGQTTSSQTFQVYTTGTDFNIGSSGGVHYFALPTASATNRGALSSTDWTTFNNKIGNITGLITPGTNVSITGSGTSGSPYVINSTAGGGGGGTVTNIASGFGLSGGPITSTGTLAADTSKLATLFSTRQEQFLDSIYNKSGFTNISDFTDNSSGYAVSGGNLVFASGAGNFAKHLDLTSDAVSTNHYTLLNHWKVEGGLIITGSSTGAAIGLTSANTFFPHYTCAQINTSNRHLVIWVDGSVVSDFDISGSFTYSANDSVFLAFERSANVFTATIRNITTSGAVIQRSAKLGFGGYSLPNTGRFCIYNIGGGFSVYKLRVISTEPKNVDCFIFGDSKSAGYNATYPEYAYSYRLGKNYSIAIEAGPGDYTAMLINCLPEVVALRPKQVLLNIGVNDISFGISSATWQANLTTIVNTLKANGIRVVIVNSMYDNTSSATLAAYINSAFPPDMVADLYNAGKRPGTVDADNVHPTNYGHYAAYEYLIGSGKLLYGNNYNRDTLFNDIRVTGNIYTGSGTAPDVIGSGDIILPADAAITSWAGATNKKGRFIPFSSNGYFEFRNYNFGITGESSFKFFIPNGAIGTQREGTSFLNNGDITNLGGLQLGLGAATGSPTGFTAGAGNLILPVDGMIGAYTGSANQRGTYMPFSGQGVSEYRNYYYSSITHKSHAWYTPNGSTNTQQESVYITDDAKLHVPAYDSTSTPLNMAYIDPITKALKVAAVPGGGGLSGSGTSGRVAYWNGSSSLTSDANQLYSSTNAGTLSLGTTNTQGHFNLGGNRNFGANGAGIYFAGTTFTDTLTATSGTRSQWAINYFAAPVVGALNTGVTTTNLVNFLIEAPAITGNMSGTNTYAVMASGSTGHIYAQGNIEVDAKMYVKGSFNGKVSAVTSNYSATTTDYWLRVDASAGNITITLPAASSAYNSTKGTGQVINFKRVDGTANTVTIQRAGSDTMDGATSFTLTAQWQKKAVVASSSTTWDID